MKGILNEKVRMDPIKKGFNASFSSLIDLKDSKTKEFIFDNCEIYEIFDRENIIKLSSKQHQTQQKVPVGWSDRAQTLNATGSRTFYRLGKFQRH